MWPNLSLVQAVAMDVCAIAAVGWLSWRSRRA